MKIGTRGSPLALAQTREVVRILAAAHARGRGRVRNHRHQNHGRHDPGSRACGSGRKGAFHQGNRRRHAKRRNRCGCAFVEGPADDIARGRDDRRLSAARRRAGRADIAERGRPGGSAESREGGKRLAAPRSASQATASGHPRSNYCAAMSKPACAMWRRGSWTQPC